MKIAFGCKMGVGKDTAADYLISKYGGQKHSFARPLYDIMNYAQQLIGVEQVKDRQFLQYIGTEWGRSKDPDIWVKVAIRDTPIAGNVYLTDVRFPNELKGLKDNGWICVKIVRETTDENRIGTGSSDHTSETAMDEQPDDLWDYVIRNDGSLQEFHEKLDIIVNEQQNKNSCRSDWGIYPDALSNWVTRLQKRPWFGCTFCARTIDSQYFTSVNIRKYLPVENIRISLRKFM